MKYGFLLIVLFLMKGMVAQQDSLFQYKSYKLNETFELPYRIMYPKNYDAKKKYPLIMMLHGSGERGNDNKKQLTHGAAVFIKNQIEDTYPAIIIFPQCPEEGYWSSVDVNRETRPLVLDFDYNRPITTSLNAVIGLTNYLINEGTVDSKKVSIAGLSMGGMGALEAAYRYPKLFRNVTAICGAGDWQAYDERVKKIKFRLYHGFKDDIVSPIESEKMIAKLRELKLNPDYRTYPEANHNSCDAAFAEPDFVSWFFR